MVDDRIQFAIQTGKELKAAKEALVSRFVKGEIDALELTAATSALIDETVELFAEEFLGDFRDKICLVFTGASGREEICPNSDCDISAIEIEPLKGKEKEDFEHFIQALIDGRIANIGPKRTIDYTKEFVLENTETWTQLIDRRFCWGNEQLYEQLSQTLDEIEPEHRVEYLKKLFGVYNDLLDDAANQDYSTTAKGLSENDGRYTVIEPNTKKGYGSLRGVQTALWVLEEAEKLGLKKANILKKEDEFKFKNAHEFILTARCHLHTMDGIEYEERLLSHLQSDIAKRMDHDDVTSFMREYFTHTREVSHYARIVCSNVAEQLGIDPPGAKSSKTVNFENGELGGPMDVMKLFLESTKKGVPLHYSAMHAIKKNTNLFTEKFTQNAEANAIMMEILSHDNAEDTLMYMNRLGVLTKFIPEMESIREFMLYDSYHAHTIDDHSIMAIGFISRIAQGEYEQKSFIATDLATELKLEERKILSTVLLLHGIYRAENPDDTQIFNRDLIQNVGSRLGLEGEDLKTATWLAENRLLLKHATHFLDAGDIDEVKEFATEIPDGKMLDLLRVLTFADTLALGPGRLTDRTSQCVDSLYDQVSSLKTDSILSDQFEQASFRLPSDYVEAEPYIKITPDERRDESVLRVITPDKPYTLQKITAAIRAEKCLIKGARIKTITIDEENDEPHANNRFIIRNSQGKKLGQRKMKALQKNLLEKLESDEIIKAPPAPARDDPSQNIKNAEFINPPDIEFSNVLKKDTTRIHIVAPFGLGLFDDVATIFNSKGLDLTFGFITRVGANAKFSSRASIRDGGQIPPVIQDELKEDLMKHFGFGIEKSDNTDTLDAG